MERAAGKLVPAARAERQGVSGALRGIPANESVQAKQILRHTVADLLAGVKFSSVFSCVDMAENLDAKAGEAIATCGYFGLLGTDYDEKTGRVIGNYRKSRLTTRFKTSARCFPGSSKMRIYR